MKTYNHYACEKCGTITIAKHEDEGVTPFRINCRATRGCDGLAKSKFYNCSQNAEQIPHVIWHRPKTVGELENSINQIVAGTRNEEINRQWLLDHYQRGGCLMKTITT